MTAGKVDAGVVRRHLLALHAALVALEPHTGKALRALDATEERWIVERGLQLAAQNVLDVATHLVAGAGRDAPDYAGAIDQLGVLGVVPPEFAAQLRGLAGFRNVLVHEYVEIDTHLVYVNLQSGIADLQAYARSLALWLQVQEA